MSKLERFDTFDSILHSHEDTFDSLQLPKNGFAYFFKTGNVKAAIDFIKKNNVQNDYLKNFEGTEYLPLVSYLITRINSHEYSQTPEERAKLEDNRAKIIEYLIADPKTDINAIPFDAKETGERQYPPIFYAFSARVTGNMNSRLVNALLKRKDLNLNHVINVNLDDEITTDTVVSLAIGLYKENSDLASAVYNLLKRGGFDLNQQLNPYNFTFPSNKFITLKDVLERTKGNMSLFLGLAELKQKNNSEIDPEQIKNGAIITGCIQEIEKILDPEQTIYQKQSKDYEQIVPINLTHLKNNTQFSTTATTVVSDHTTPEA